MYIYIQAVTYLAVWALPFVALVKPWLRTLIKNCSYAFVSWDIFWGNYSLQLCNSNFYGVSWLQVPHFGVVSESVWWNGKKVPRSVIVNSPDWRFSLACKLMLAWRMHRGSTVIISSVVSIETVEFRTRMMLVTTLRRNHESRSKHFMSVQFCRTKVEDFGISDTFPNVIALEVWIDL